MQQVEAVKGNLAQFRPDSMFQRGVVAWRASSQSFRSISTQTDATRHLTAMVRERDYGAYLTHIAYPRHLQPHFFALRAFYIELASLKDTLSNELVGRIRMQWWRDAIEGVYHVCMDALPIESAAQASHHAGSS